MLWNRFGLGLGLAGWLGRLALLFFDSRICHPFPAIFSAKSLGTFIILPFGSFTVTLSSPDTGPFSDYPELVEVTLPPCTFLEVQGCRVKRNFTTAEGYHHTGAVLYVDVTPQFQQAR